MWTCYVDKTLAVGGNVTENYEIKWIGINENKYEKLKTGQVTFSFKCSG